MAQFAFKSKYNKYLYHVNTEETPNLLVFSGDEITSPCAKFEVEAAKSRQNLVHIRSCYNNKYWVRQSEDSKRIVAAADKQEEDQSKWSCTLFRMIHPDGTDGTVQYIHDQLGNYVCSWRGDERALGSLVAESSSPDQDLSDVFTTTNWDSFVVLPKFVAFKGDNGTYIGDIFSEDLLVFMNGETASSYVRNEIVPMSDGSIRIKYLSSQIVHDQIRYFMHLTDVFDNVLAVTEDKVNNSPSDALFWPIKVRDDVIALRCLGNNKFVRRSDEGAVIADADIVSDQAKLQVEETIISRKVYNVNFRLDDARIYDEAVISMDSRVADNAGNEADTHLLELKYTDSKSSTWSAGVSLKLGASIQFTTGIPLIFEFKVTLSATFEGSYQWGATQESSTELSSNYKVTVPPKSRVTLELLATRGKCDVPFSYQQLDTFTDGTQIVKDMDDGVYTGINCYNFTYDVKETPLPM